MTLQQMKYAITVAEKGSMNEAAKELYISQPSLSGSIRELENELGFDLFMRSSRGITLTVEGQEFLGYARQTLEQFRLMEDKYLTKKPSKKHFRVSTQHYSFVVEAFAKLIKEIGMDSYEFAIYETRTAEVISDVRNFRSDIGILYLDDFNEPVLQKMLRENELLFTPLFDCNIYVYISNEHPLAKRKVLTMEDLEEYPCLSFDQGTNNSFYLAEEVFSNYDYKRLIKTNDRASNLNIMKALNGYTLCSGIISETLNGNDFVAIRLDTDLLMHIGFVTRKDAGQNQLRDRFVELLRAASAQVL